jgi:thermostable 8-oxoguanine DNA glycosylase
MERFKISSIILRSMASAESQATELRRSFNMAADATRESIGRVADGMKKESSHFMQNLGSHNQQVIQIVSEAVDDNLVAQKQISNAYIGICNALAQQLRLSGFGW